MKLNLPQAFAETVADRLEVDVRVDYSGRGMYGNTCFGFVGDQRDLVRFLLELGDIIDELNSYEADPSDDSMIPVDLEPWQGLSQDNMGLHTIYYWPNIHIVGEEADGITSSDIDFAPDAHDRDFDREEGMRH